jgi:F0F1-type ATP synthase assembly protein I
MQLALAVLVFFFIGWWCDSTFDTTPWGRLLGALVGTTGGMIKFFKTVTGPDFQPRKDRKPPDAH